MGLVARSPRAIGVITAQSLGMGAKGLLATAGTGGLSRLLTAGVSGLSSGSVESGATIAEVLQESGVEPTDPYALARALRDPKRSEEHTSELQSLMRISYAGFRLNKKKNR